jgi:hypothetical protein
VSVRAKTSLPRDLAIKTMAEGHWRKLWLEDHRIARGKIIVANEARHASYDLDLYQVRVILGTGIKLRVTHPFNKSAPQSDIAKFIATVPAQQERRCAPPQA